MHQLFLLVQGLPSVEKLLVLFVKPDLHDPLEVPGCKISPSPLLSSGAHGVGDQGPVHVTTLLQGDHTTLPPHIQALNDSSYLT